MEKINELANNIQQLIDISLREKEQWTQRAQFLFQQLERVQQIISYEREKNSALLPALLTLQAFIYHTEINKEKVLEKIRAEVELVRKKIEYLTPKRQSASTIKPTEQEKKEASEYLNKVNE